MTIALVVAAVLALLRDDLTLVLPLALLALWLSLGGHYVELSFLRGIRPRIHQGRVAQVGARLLTWFAGGVVLSVCMATTARALPIPAAPLRAWWYGGLLFIGLELAVHSILAARGLPSFFNGRG